MFNSLKSILYIILIGAAIFLAWRIGFNQNLFKANQTQSSTVMLEKVKLVTKMVTVEGQFSEIFEKKEWYKYDYLNLFSKKILIRVNAKVSVGYDFEHINITTDSLTKTLTLNEFPAPQILSIDHDLDYYDITEGTFNRFTAEEYNAMHKEAKNLILKKAHESNLLELAQDQKKNYVEMLEMALRSVGWKFVVKPDKRLLG
jgi:hypothetical protein